METLPLSALVLTYNEEANIEACLRSLHGWVDAIFLVDSGSTDGTLDIVRRYTDHVYTHPFASWGLQLNWALAALPWESDWIIRLDADEYVTPALRDELRETLPALTDAVSALYCKRRVHFMGRWIRHGGCYPVWLMRVFRRHRVCFEQHLGEAEHPIVREGAVAYLKHDIVDDNRKGLTFWTLKHEGYAQREVASLMDTLGAARVEMKGALRGTPEQKRRWFKTNVYARTPLFLRAVAYFGYRYFLRLGFLDGVEGLIFHVLQGFWYRFYIDARIWEMRRNGRTGP
ncbi:MAG: glycosyltransferase family 2 protein [Anaerolineae bacterium]|nr:glycosyltransferase family 2 protein [Anaerolineae bacterium]